MTTYAGLYGPEALIDGSGHPITSATIDVFTHGTTTHVSLYQDNARVTPLSNPVPNGVDGSTAGRGLDTFGNLSFYVDPGRYDLRIATGAGTRTVEIEIETDPAESAASSAATTGTIYVAAAGNDANDGFSWQTAKATIAAAITALPASGGNHIGRVQVGAGNFAVSSSRRRDAATFTNGSAVVTDVSAASGDVGAFVSPDNDLLSGTVAVNTTVLSVVPGVSFTMSANAQANGTGHAFLDKPAIVLPPGVSIYGASTPAWPLGTEMQSNIMGTTITDSGTGITIRCSDPAAAVAGLHESRGYLLEDLVIVGNAANFVGVYFGDADNELNITRCAVLGHGSWGLTVGLAGSFSAYLRAVQSWFAYNGTAGATVDTGGVYLGGGSLTNTFYDCHMVYNKGHGVLTGSGSCAYINCEINAQTATSKANTGYGVSIRNAGGPGMSFTCCWFEANAHGVHIESGSDPTHVKFADCGFSGDSLTDYGIVTGTGGGSGTIYIALDQNLFYGHTSYSINNAAGAKIYWDGRVDSRDSTGFITPNAITAVQGTRRGSTDHPNGYQMVLGTAKSTKWHASTTDGAITMNGDLLVTHAKELPACTITGLGMTVTAAIAATTLRLAIYADDGFGYPGKLLLDTGTAGGSAATLDASTTGDKSITGLSLALASGTYHFAAVAHGGSPNVCGIFSAPKNIPVAGSLHNVLNLGLTGYQQAAVTAAPPATFTATVAEAGGSPNIAYLVA